jgi:hypothetical protein
MPCPEAVSWSTHIRSSGIHTAKSGSFVPSAPSWSATCDDSRALTRTSRQRPSVRVWSARAWSAIRVRAGAMSGGATAAIRTVPLWQVPPAGSSLSRSTTKAPAPATRTRVVVTAAALRRARGLAPDRLPDGESCEGDIR